MAEDEEGHSQPSTHINNEIPEVGRKPAFGEPTLAKLACQEHGRRAGIPALKCAKPVLWSGARDIKLQRLRAKITALSQFQEY